jgi:hypothetical protein
MTIEDLFSVIFSTSAWARESGFRGGLELSEDERVAH